MKTTSLTSFKILSLILLVVCLLLLATSAIYQVQSMMTSVGWHGLASVGWHG